MSRGGAVVLLVDQTQSVGSQRCMPTLSDLSPKMTTIVYAVQRQRSEPRKAFVLRGRIGAIDDPAAECCIDGKGLMELNIASNPHETNSEVCEREMAKNKVRFDDRLAEYNTQTNRAQHTAELQRFNKGLKLWRSPQPGRQPVQHNGYLGGKQFGHYSYSHSHAGIFIVPSGRTSAQPGDQNGKITNLYM